MADRETCWQSFEGLSWTGLGDCHCDSSNSDCHWIRLHTNYNKCIRRRNLVVGAVLIVGTSAISIGFRSDGGSYEGRSRTSTSHSQTDRDSCSDYHDAYNCCTSSIVTNPKTISSGFRVQPSTTATNIGTALCDDDIRSGTASADRFTVVANHTATKRLAF
ncbi:unnamed protein product [Heligmosomoides polygyrus]|uniref:Uncharacterized protein n=1 Tax=Heligmosomoides polygyrus TaxID=6339 RepID=A0A183FMR7_HELPZ|nr:unnamed protein product [Heligmosomoides polygyrus]